MTPEKFLVTCAIPYANGPLHIGHLAGCYVPGDVYARFRRMQGHDVHFVCGTDEYGAAITILAKTQNTTPRAIVDKYHAILKQDMINCNMSFDIFSRTTHPCHTTRAQDFFINLYNNGLIDKKSEKRLYCERDKQFLPDRYVVGECPVCGSSGARGDQCEKCGSWYEPEALKNPICQICKIEKATLKETSHWYILLNKLESKLQSWLETKSHWRKQVLGYAFQPIKAELQPRAITRDLDWGVPVPLKEAKDKVLYVWFDAPIGYISASEDWSIQKGEPEAWRNYWEDKNTKLIHFIGKDNIIFHTVIWPAVLMGDNRYILPDLVAGNEFLNLEGEKISTSRNFAIWVSDVLKDIEPDYLRFYLTRIAPETSDSNFTWQDYQLKINTELADCIGNLVNRSLSFINKNYEGKLKHSENLSFKKIFSMVESTLSAYTIKLEQGLTRASLEEVIQLARNLNGYFQELAPWQKRKIDSNSAIEDLTSIAFGIKAIAIMLSPVCPTFSDRIWEQLGEVEGIQDKILKGHSIYDNCLIPFKTGHKIGQNIIPIVQKVDDNFVTLQKEKLGLK